LHGHQADKILFANDKFQNFYFLAVEWVLKIAMLWLVAGLDKSFALNKTVSVLVTMRAGLVAWRRSQARIAAHPYRGRPATCSQSLGLSCRGHLGGALPYTAGRFVPKVENDAV
jgi:hypothetical protein